MLALIDYAYRKTIKINKATVKKKFTITLLVINPISVNLDSSLLERAMH